MKGIEWLINRFDLLFQMIQTKVYLIGYWSEELISEKLDSEVEKNEIAEKTIYSLKLISSAILRFQSINS